MLEGEDLGDEEGERGRFAGECALLEFGLGGGPVEEQGEEPG